MMGYFAYGSLARGAADEAVSGVRSQARSNETKTREMSMQIERLSLACEALWTLLHDKLGVTEEEFLNRINDLDLADGELDGKRRQTPVSCPQCNRTIARRFPNCMYCGQPVMHDPFA